MNDKLFCKMDLDDWEILSLVYKVSPRFYAIFVLVYIMFFISFKKKFHSVLIKAVQKDLVVAVIGSIHSLQERTVQIRHAVEKLLMYTP